MGSRSRDPPRYPSLAFHAIRSLSILFSSGVTGIVFYFAYILRRDDFKIPWTYLIILAASVFSLIFLLLTSCISACGSLSPFFNLIFNIPLFVLWVVILLFTYDIYGTLGHACTVTNWGNSTGVTICNIYKLLYSFMLFACLAQLAQIVLDIRVRRAQKIQGTYDRMQEDNAGSSRGKSMTLDALDANGSRRRTRDQDPDSLDGVMPYWNDERASQHDGRGDAYGAATNTHSTGDSGSLYSNAEIYRPTRDFTYYHTPSESTGYDPPRYAYSNRY